jgi:hypothetical protein
MVRTSAAPQQTTIMGLHDPHGQTHPLSTLEPSSVLGRRFPTPVPEGRGARHLRRIVCGRGFVHVVEAEGEVQRRDQSWLRELQFRHHRNRELISRLPSQVTLARREFEEMSDQQLCESYFSGRQSSQPTVEVVAPGGIVISHQSLEPILVRRRGFLSLLDE